MRACLLLLLLAILSSTSSAEGNSRPTPQDFAAGFTFTAPEDGLLYRLELPDACLARSVDPGRQDLAVFNSDGLPLPFSPYYPETTLRTEAQQAAIIATLQTPEPAAGLGDGTNMVIIMDGQTAGNPRIITEQAESAPKVTAYIARLPEPDLQATGISIRWRADEFTQIVRARVEQADTLNADNWEIVADGPLAQVPGSADTPGLENIRLPLPGKRLGQYLKISFPELADAPALLAVEVESQRAQLPDFHSFSTELPALAEPGPNNAAVFELDMSGGKWVRSLEIVPLSPVIWRGARLLGRQTPEQDWLVLGHIDLFRINRGSSRTAVTNGSLAFNRELPRYLRLEVPKDAKGKSGLSLKALYLQPGLVFQAQAPGPYTLACGSGTIRLTADIDAALLSLSEAQSVNIDGAPVILGGEAALAAPGREDAADTVRVVLWVVLGAGVLALGGMILVLYRNMKKNS